MISRPARAPSGRENAPFNASVEQNTAPKQPTRVLIVDDSERTRDGVSAFLATWPGVEVVGEAANGRDAVLQMAECKPDVVLMDLRMPVMDGVEATRNIKEQWPAVRVVVLSMYAEQRKDAIAAGADVFLIKGGPPEWLLTSLGIPGDSEP